ncbi:hypothetical protein BEP19_08355 [Ammoniphilus oxalaticus]|uniref:DUF1806 domain-containing protein n=1 Tax=Ammoniphilus oxalaticus TaxID=66863 RepID=A0A419SK49_9BACL|nr:YojF family protein [Ammoniphilus oxalaticus]RKD24393.1 hypothetical protein BEP19_08355 [Ammoniphilus oxalaticus]
MKPIKMEIVQQQLDQFTNQPIYLHLETTQGAYTALSAGAYIRNAKIMYLLGKITGQGPYRVGLKLEHGWVYAEGLTDFTIDEQGRLLLAGHTREGKLNVALQLSQQPF